MQIIAWMQGLAGLGLLGLMLFELVGRLSGRRRFRLNRLALGNAFQSLQAIVEPETRHRVVEMMDETVDEEADGGPDDPQRHLLRQARRLQRGERLERLTALRRLDG